MSKISEHLRTYAQEEKQAHESYIKDFTAATVAHLVQGGIDKGKASLLAKEACLRDPELIKSVSRAVILEKTAEYIESIEDENVKLAAKIDLSKEVEKKADELPEHLKVFEKMGFSKDEIEAMKDVPDKILEKLATVQSEPWEMGKPSGMPTPQRDPLLDFILS
jgi:hypothetical protein